VQRVRRPVLAGLLAGTVVLLAACSDPAPVAPPAPAPSSAAAPSAAPSTPGPATSTPATTAAPTTAAPPPPQPSGDGTVEPNKPVQTAPPKKLDQPARTAGAQVSLVSVKATAIKATKPGDRSGPGVLVRLKLVNSTKRTLDTSFTQVSLTGTGGQAGTLVDGPPSKPLGSSLRVGRSAEAAYAFLLDGAGSAPVTVSVYVTSGQPVVTFRGQAS